MPTFVWIGTGGPEAQANAIAHAVLGALTTLAPAPSRRTPLP